MEHLPSPEDTTRIRREAFLARAVEGYKYFYPTVSMLLNFEALADLGAKPNRGFVLQLTTPDIVTLTQNSDTPYGLAVGDATAGPVVVELPPGPLMGVVDDANFAFVTNMGLVGEEAGAGARYLLLPPGWDEPAPDGYLVRRLETHRFLVCVRAPDPDAARGLDHLRGLRLYPLAEAGSPPPNDYQDVSDRSVVADPVAVDGTPAYWDALKRALDGDVPAPSAYVPYGLLADLGLRHDRPFAPDAETAELLADAARRADEQLVVAAFASTAPERLVWPDRHWEWVVWSEGDAGYREADFLRLSVRERWFYQATLETPKMFVQREGAGSLYWLAAVDAEGAPLDGARTYRLEVPLPVPAAQFWSVTLYDLHTRSEIRTERRRPLVTSLRDRIEPGADGAATLRFGPEAPEDPDAPWVQTDPDRAWFAYFRIYGPGAAAFDGTWRPSDLVAD